MKNTLELYHLGFKEGAEWQATKNPWTLVSFNQPPSNVELLVQSPAGVNHLANWREAYSIFTCQDKSESSADWKWRLI